MALFRRRPTPPPPDDDADQVIGELLNRDHHRASILTDDGAMLVEPGGVLENFALTMERLDNDINTPVGVADAASFEEIAGLVQMGMGSFLAVHLVNTAMRIMSARYPVELITAPLPEQYDLRKLAPLTFTDAQHETARRIFNERTRSAADLQVDDLYEMWQPLNDSDQIQVIVALFFMFGSKVGAMKYRAGME